MNALVGIRSNATGILSPTPEMRDAVSQQLAATAASRAGTTTANVASANTNATGSTEQPTTGLQIELGKDVFLQLLVLQLQNQDPLEPVSNTDMLAQLAQFSALEAQNNLNKNFEILSGNIDQLNFISASQLLGTIVEGIDINGEFRSGIVESVHLNGSLVVLRVDGELMTMAGITKIEGGQGSGLPDGADLPDGTDPPPETAP